MNTLKRIRNNILVGFVVLASVVGAGATLAPSSAHAASCASHSFFGLPDWWRGLKTDSTGEACAIIINTDGGDYSDIWTIVANIVDILLRLIGLVAVGFIIFGGVRYVISQGEAGPMAAAKQTISRAIIGLVIAILSVLILNFVAGTVLGLTVSADYKVTK